MTTLLAARRGVATAAPARPFAVLVVVLAGQFMAVLDVSIVTVAAADIRTDLRTSGAALQLVVSGYTISYAVLLVAGARLGDRLGHARAYRIGLAAFTVMSLLCGLSPATGTLVTARVLQGVGAALMMPQVMSLIQRTFSGAGRARALSWYAAVIALGSVVGQVLGGVLVSADIAGTGWRPVFLVNVPVGVALLIAAARLLPREAGNRDRRVDLPGTVVLAAAVLLLVLPLVLGHETGWPLWCFVGLAGSVVAFAGFVGVERRVERRGGVPILTRRVLRAPGLPLAAGIILLNLATYGGFLFTMALHLQSGLGESPARAGLIFIPVALGFAFTGLTWQRLPQRLHGVMIPSGFAVAALGYLALAPVLSGGGSGGWPLFAGLAVVGLALGLAHSPLMGRALHRVPISDAADASGVLVTVIQLGQVIGVAAFGTFYLELVDGPGAHESAHALAATLVGIAVLVAIAVVLAARAVRTPQNGAYPTANPSRQDG